MKINYETILKGDAGCAECLPFRSGRERRIETKRIQGRRIIHKRNAHRTRCASCQAVIVAVCFTFLIFLRIIVRRSAALLAAEDEAGARTALN